MRCRTSLDDRCRPGSQFGCRRLVGRLQRRMSDDMVRGGGSFVMGCDPEIYGWNCVAEEPAQLVKVEAFELDRFEVTADEYDMCRRRRLLLPAQFWISDELSRIAEGTIPLTLADWVEAHTFLCMAWQALTDRCGWEKAARGPDGLRFPWGNEPMPSVRYRRLLIKMMSQIMELRAVAPDLVGQLEVDLRVQARMVSKT